MNEKVYIHYGCTKETFDKSKVKPVGNMIIGQKPSGCFWASSEDAKFGWKEWNECEQFVSCDEDNCLRFILSKDSRVALINSVSDLEFLPKINGSSVRLDFEEIAKIYDAMEVNISNDKNLYFSLYGWDCDSICIFNADIIVPIKED